MLNMSIFADTADIYEIIHFVPHPCQHITVDQSHSSGDTVAKIPEISNYRRGLLKKTWRDSLSIGVRITMIRCIVYLL
jgi:hypothetical protein